MPVLTSDQYQQLHDLLETNFDKKAMAAVVQYSLGERLDVIVNVDQPYGAVCSDLLNWLDRQGRSKLEVLLRGVTRARPNEEGLRNFCERNLPAALRQLKSDILVKDFSLGLKVLIDLKDNPTVRQTVGGFRADFETTQEQIEILEKYKRLHDSLHELQLRLGAIEDVLARSKSDPNVVRGLATYAIDLEFMAMEAGSKISGLPSRPVEEAWIEDFEVCIKDMSNAARSAAIPADLKNLPPVGERLRALLREAPRINNALANAADSLKLDSFAMTMDVIAQTISANTAPNDPALQQLVASSAAITVLRSRLAGLVGEHYEWQVFNTQLDSAELSSNHQPQARMPRWQKFKDGLARLCDLYPQESWSHQIDGGIKRWMAATLSTAPSDAERIEGENAFNDFHRTCILRFFAVDKELNSLSGEITKVAIPLNTLLTVIK
jgi:hypothetical protein